MQLQWSPQLATGVTQVDEEHKVLITELNKLGVMLESKQLDLPQALAFMNFLGTYTARHFAHEEKCMHAAQCPTAAANKAAHAEFIKMFVAAKLHLASGGSIDELRTLHATLRDWVRSHIMKIDTGLRGCRHGVPIAT